MSLVTATHAEYDDSVVLNTETNTFVLGYTSPEVTEFIYENSMVVFRAADYSTEAEYLAAALQRHTDLVNEAQATGMDVHYHA